MPIHAITIPIYLVTMPIQVVTMPILAVTMRRSWWSRCADPGGHDGASRAPAHAGMDRSRGSDAARSRGLPRPRGDGPGHTTYTRRPCEAPPPTRGWTHAQQRALLGGRGSPAHAGMDPNPPRDVISAARLPRPRGDGPHPLWGRVFALAAPPPTRGWTPAGSLGAKAARGWTGHRALAGLVVPGSSAHAGMGSQVDAVSQPTLRGAQAASRTRTPDAAQSHA
jgi:hypothetical protein